MPNQAVGQVFECLDGRLGVVTQVREYVNKGYTLYIGVGTDGKPWQSKEPRFVATSVQDLFELINSGEVQSFVSSVATV